jgi:hypothetical protein
MNMTIKRRIVGQLDTTSLGWLSGMDNETDGIKELEVGLGSGVGTLWGGGKVIKSSRSHEMNIQ